MDAFKFTDKSQTVAEAASNLAGQVGTSAGNVLDATKIAGRHIGSVAQVEMTSLRADLDDLIASLPSLSEQDLLATKERLIAKIEASKVAATGAVKSVTNEVSQQFHRGVDVTTDYVKVRPLQSVAVAAGIGLLLGMLISRR